jgi:hypothetical protein
MCVMMMNGETNLFNVCFVCDSNSKEFEKDKEGKRMGRKERTVNVFILGDVHL